MKEKGITKGRPPRGFVLNGTLLFWYNICYNNKVIIGGENNYGKKNNFYCF